jgi:hypothetical protein
MARALTRTPAVNMSGDALAVAAPDERAAWISAGAARAAHRSDPGSTGSDGRH